MLFTMAQLIIYKLNIKTNEINKTPLREQK